MSNRVLGILCLLLASILMIGAFVLAYACDAPRGYVSAFHFCTWVFVACALFCLWREIRTWPVLALFVGAAVRAGIYLVSLADNVRAALALKNGTELELQSYELYIAPFIVISILGLVVGTVGCLIKQFRNS